MSKLVNNACLWQNKVNFRVISIFWIPYFRVFSHPRAPQLLSRKCSAFPQQPAKFVPAVKPSDVQTALPPPITPDAHPEFWPWMEAVFRCSNQNQKFISAERGRSNVKPQKCLIQAPFKLFDVKLRKSLWVSQGVLKSLGTRPHPQLTQDCDFYPPSWPKLTVPSTILQLLVKIDQVSVWIDLHGHGPRCTCKWTQDLG